MNGQHTSFFVLGVKSEKYSEDGTCFLFGNFVGVTTSEHCVVLVVHRVELGLFRTSRGVYLPSIRFTLVETLVVVLNNSLLIRA